jgi:hypothetical protein
LHFSRNYFFGWQKPVFPLFLGDLKSDWAENFFGDTSTNLGGILFFFCRYLLSIKIGRIRKIIEMLKCLKFSEILSILVLLPEVLGIFQKKKKYTPRLGTSTYSKNFSSNGWNLWNCKGENFRPFLDLVVSGSPWRWGLANLCLWQLLLYYSRPIYPESFKNFRSAVS